ncbi:MAG: HDOD domain-containing protein [Rhodoferax sp.]|uniref:HDOD domain-containing protein n=1 Tax=Rhodoferax sp. TaxID=50421 RepID=UPI00271BFA87|nr:HDOD domain-containing protein [Rhodoferax sp.]MDO8448976.1 HDOD domain-containing protein [Rhodoferax sp.]
MAKTVLGSVSLGYQLLWNQLRQLGGVQLFVGADDTAPVDAPHLLSALDESWSGQAPTLLLSVQSPRLLADMLDHGTADSPWIEVHESLLRDPAMAQRAHRAHQRGMKLIWRGEPGQRPSAALASCFLRNMVALTAEEALAGLRVSLRKHNGTDASQSSKVTSPVLAGQIYEAVASRVLTEHCLDEQKAWGVAGWPMEDVLHGYRQQRIQPGHRAIVRLTEAIDADDSVEHIELILSEEPILAYRFMRYANSAGLGLRTGIDSIRHGLMVLGLSQLRSWLLEQLPHATSDLNLQPVRTALVLRARLMEQLLDAGDGNDLRREVYLCGLLSQMDLMLGEPLNAALARFPVSERVTSAILDHSGPYVPYLEMATALESANTQATRVLCDLHRMNLEEVNRALLRTLSNARPHPAKGLLLV